MHDTIEHLDDGTLSFLPERLNRDPVVLRGLTNDEMWLALGLGAILGLVLGVPLSIATASLAVAPSGMIAGIAMTLFVAGTLLRRAKRARPETWLYRRLEWLLASRWRVGHGTLILHSGAWTIRRSRRPRPPLARWPS